MLPTSPGTGVTSPAGIVVVFRNDDPSSTSDAAHEQRVASIFERWGIPQTLGVIPLCAADDWHDRRGTRHTPLDANPAMVDFLRRGLQAGWEIALHGYTHRTNERSLPQRREYFEFKRLSVAEAQNRLERGMSLIASVLETRPDTFIPPWNRIDGPSLEACARVGLSILSAGPFAPATGTLVNFGTDCTIDELPDRIQHATRTQRPAFIRVLYHSRTTRTPEELGALERALAAAATAPRCEVLTIRETVRRYPEAVRAINEAARNTVPEDHVPGSARARGAVYRRVWPELDGAAQLEREYRQARTAYGAGEYEQAASHTPVIDRLSAGLVARSRLTIAAATFAGVALLVQVLAGVAPPSTTFAGVLAVILIAGLACRWKATSPDTRSEMLTATMMAVGGGTAAFLLREIVLLVASWP